MKKLSYFCPPEDTGFFKNPRRGFYTIFRHVLNEDDVVETPVINEQDSLILVEINLCNFREKALSDKALSNLAALFNMLRKTERALIIRFLYDWDGKNLLNEPRDFNLIISHIGSVAPTVKENADIIFVTQGLFIGDWGEMHGSRFAKPKYLKKLFVACCDSFGDKITLSVRTPAQWRLVTGCLSADECKIGNIKPAFKLPALFNDGMLGSLGDLGTYGETKEARDAELDFQDKLCSFVPCGGEVVGKDPLSDPAAALTSLRKMHVTYLNRDHDPETLERWKEIEISAEGAWKGRSFFEYVGAHLGYRFMIKNVSLKKPLFSKGVSAIIALENTGFASVYRDVTPELIISGGEEGDVTAALSGDIKTLAEKNTEPMLLKTEKPVDISALSPGEYEVYFRLIDTESGSVIMTANEGNCDRGCLIGRLIKK